MNRKAQVFRKYGLAQTLEYYYVLWNAINYAGEEWVRDSFESVKHLNVTVSDYSSDDGTPELAKEYGFKVINVPKTKGAIFNESKCQNAFLHQAKSNFTVDLSIHYNYPKVMNEFYKFWLSKNINRIGKVMLSLRAKYFTPDGRFEKYATGPWLTYRPFLLEARGFDERCHYPWGGGPYYLRIMRIVWGLEVEEQYIGIVHKQHYKLRDGYRKKVFGIPNPNYNPNKTRMESSLLAKPIEDNFEKGIKGVVNSYW